MGSISLALILFVGLKSAFALTTNETQAVATPSNATLGDAADTLPPASRKGRHIVEERIELAMPGKKIKRQIITIPPSVSKVKLVQPPLNLRHGRGPQQFKRYPQGFRSGPPRRSNRKKTQTDHAFRPDEPFAFDSKKVKRNLKKPIKSQGSIREVYEYEERDDEGRQKGLGYRSPQEMKTKRKKPKTNVLGDYLAGYEGEEDGGGFETSKNRSPEETASLYNYDSAATNIRMKQIPPPNLFPLNGPEAQKQPRGPFFDENYVPGLNIKKIPAKSRQIQSLFSQQYTTHNPHVTTNFGLSDFGGREGFRHGGLHKGSFVDATPYDFPGLGKFHQPAVAASEQVVTALPGLTPGIQVIQPPQFRDVTVSHPLHPSRLTGASSQQKEEISSQRATIRDILDQDCPSYDSKGYCESPPRYPMQQIGNMVKKCSNLMEVMNTQPFEEPHGVYGFSKRSDHQWEAENSANATDQDSDNALQWSRSSNDEVTVCSSELTFTEPGYAREATSGRWFVIVQHPDTTIQRIATDTCRNAGKPCGGLSALKCSKSNGFPNKSTRCVQRFTYQRLISWDPELPEGCPRMRVFRFPSACVCHLAG